MKLAEINEVVKASPAIQIQSKISLLQRRRGTFYSPMRIAISLIKTSIPSVWLNSQQNSDLILEIGITSKKC